MISQAFDGSTALHYAARQGCTEMMQLLIKSGAAMDAKDSDGDTPATKAESVGNVMPNASGTLPWPLWEPSEHGRFPIEFRQKALYDPHPNPDP